MKPCDFDETMLDLLVDGLLTPSEEDAVRAHLAQCPHCARRVRQLEELRAAVAALDGPAPEELHGRIMAALAREQAGPAAQAPKRPLLRRTAFLRAVAACAVFATAAVLWRVAQPDGLLPKSPAPFESSAPTVADEPAEGAVPNEGIVPNMDAAPNEALTASPRAPEESDSLALPYAYAAGAKQLADELAAGAYNAVYTYAGDMSSLASDLGGLSERVAASSVSETALVVTTGGEEEEQLRLLLAENGFEPAEEPYEELTVIEETAAESLYILLDVAVPTP